MPAAQGPCFGHLLHDGFSNSLNDPLISPVLTKSKLVAEIKKVVVIDRANLVTTPDEDKLLKLLVEAFEQLKSMTDGLSGE